MKRHPMQPVYITENGVARFKENKIIQHLFETRALDLNVIGCMDFSDEDRMQIAQLLGYSVSGFGDLSYAKNKVIKKADKKAEKLWKKKNRDS